MKTDKYADMENKESLSQNLRMPTRKWFLSDLDQSSIDLTLEKLDDQYDKFVTSAVVTNLFLFLTIVSASDKAILQDSSIVLELPLFESKLPFFWSVIVCAVIISLMTIYLSVLEKWRRVLRSVASSSRARYLDELPHPLSRFLRVLCLKGLPIVVLAEVSWRASLIPDCGFWVALCIPVLFFTSLWFGLPLKYEKKVGVWCGTIALGMLFVGIVIGQRSAFSREIKISSQPVRFVHSKVEAKTTVATTADAVEFPENDLKELERIKNILNNTKSRGSRVIIESHVGINGNGAEQRMVRAKSAEAAKNYLIEMGVEPNRITTKIDDYDPSQGASVNGLSFSIRSE